MKNIHVIQTNKPSRLFYDISMDKLVLASTSEVSKWFENKNIYITSDEEIKEGDWYIFFNNPVNIEIKKDKNDAHGMCSCKKIILTTDQELINDGVQSIDDEFLEWFVKNPSCERVETYSLGIKNQLTGESGHYKYEIIIPKEEPKQETLTYSEAAKKEERLFNSTMIFKQETLEEVLGSSMCQFSVIENKLATLYRNQVKIYNSINRQQEKMYSEEEAIQKIIDYVAFQFNVHGELDSEIKKWFEQFKKK